MLARRAVETRLRSPQSGERAVAVRCIEQGNEVSRLRFDDLVGVVFREGDHAIAFSQPTLPPVPFVIGLNHLIVDVHPLGPREARPATALTLLAVWLEPPEESIGVDHPKW